MTRRPDPCPKCGGPARAAYVRAEREPGAKGAPYEPTGDIYCKKCQIYSPRPPEK